MIHQTPEEKLRELNKELIHIVLMEVPAMVLLALAFYARFAADNEALHPLLSDSTVVNSMLTVGGILLVLSTKRVFTWARKRKEILEQIN